MIKQQDDDDHSIIHKIESRIDTNQNINILFKKTCLESLKDSKSFY